MIREIINFTNSIDDKFKSIGLLPKEGMHILLSRKLDENNTSSIDVDNFRFEVFSKKQKTEISDFLKECISLQQNAWCIDTNKCFDLPTKAIHSCSPFCVAFKRDHIVGGNKYNENEEKNKVQIYKRFKNYFEKAFSLFEDEKDCFYYDIFRIFFTNNEFSILLNKIELENSEKREKIRSQIIGVKELLKTSTEKEEKESLKIKITELEQENLKYRIIDDSDYFVFYFEESIEKYKESHQKYLTNNLFNTGKYNIENKVEGLIFGTNNFLNGFNSNMPFLMHQTASFDISGRISNIDARLLYDFQRLLPNKTLPNPLPIFVYKEELNEKMIGLFKESGFKMNYQEIVKSLIKNQDDDLMNYYLLFWQNTKDGLVFKDFDFVSKFEYVVDGITLKNLFEIKEKDTGKDKFYPTIHNVFEFEQSVFKPLIQNTYLRLDYFGDLDKKNYYGRDFSFVSYSKYRKSVYDYVYKSQRIAIDGNTFDDMIFSAIKDDIKGGKSYGIKDKLNIWYSLYEYFNPNKNKNSNMESKLKSYQDFVNDIAEETAELDLSKANDKNFAFAAGQVIYYLLEKSKSADKSYQLLEPYLQKSKCTELKQAIANDFARYKHENFSRRYERVAAFVLSYETDANIKHLLPELLSGVFAKNQLFSNQ